MSVVYSENRVSPAAQAKMAELELALATARHFVRHCEMDPEHSEEFRALASKARSQADACLVGTIHSFTPSGASR